MLLVALMLGGCCPEAQVNRPAGPASTLPESAELATPATIGVLDATVDPPIGWRRDRYEVDSRHAQIVWLSPSGDTAYGVIAMHLPLPVGPELVLWTFRQEVRNADRQADLLSKEPAPDLPGIRFVMDSGTYHWRANLIVRGWQAWVVYAGTLRAKPVADAELLLAEHARDRTRIGISGSTRAPSKN